MKYTEKTTSVEILEFFKDSVDNVLDDIGEMYDRFDNAKMDERLLAVKTRKKLINWFNHSGGL